MEKQSEYCVECDGWRCTVHPTEKVDVAARARQNVIDELKRQEHGCGCIWRVERDEIAREERRIWNALLLVMGAK